MNKILAVIRREFIERVRTRAFIIGTLIVPLTTFAFAYIPQLLIRRDTRPRSLVIVDAASGTSGAQIEAALRLHTVGTAEAKRARYNLVRLRTTDPERVRDSLIAQVDVASEAGSGLDGLLVLTDAGLDDGKLKYYGSNVASINDMRILERAIAPVVRSARLQRLGADSAMLAAAAVNLDLQTSKVSEGKLTGESGESSFWLAYITSFVMYFSLILYGLQVMSAVLEEKSNRIVEVLISSVTPFELLLGKVIGVAGAGLLQIGIWASAAFLITSRMTGGAASGVEQVAVDGTRQSVSVPTVSVELVVVVLTFFLLGFLLYSALYAAVGAMCSSQQETQQAAQPVTILLALGFISMFALINDSSSGLAQVLSYIPFFAPLVMPVRYALSPLPLIQVLGSAAATLLGVVAVVWVAGRIYRVGILSYGKKPSLREVWSWVRTA